MRVIMNSYPRHQLRDFFILTFAFSWLVWLPGVLAGWGVIGPIPSTPLILLGGLGPAFAAIVLTLRAEGGTGFTALMASSFDPRKGWVFWIAAFVLLVIVHAAARQIYAIVSDNLPVSAQVDSAVTVIVFFVIVFFIGGGLDEEIGWRGYALDRLQVRFNALSASLILSAFWIVWHLPVFYMSGSHHQSLIPFWLFVISVFPLGILLTSVYNATGSIFAAAVFHTTGNVALEVFPIMPSAESSALTGMYILTALYTLAAIAVLVAYGPKRLAPERKQSAGA